MGARSSGSRAASVRRVFLLSPAHCDGERARLLRGAEAAFELAARVRRQGAPLGEIFSFLSGLYFRGKLAYARAFAIGGAFVITPSDGLCSPEAVVTLDDLQRYASVPIGLAEPRYRLPLTRDCAALARQMGRNADVVLLGSLATPKYLDILLPIFGPSLRLPREFFGRGDMSRGALLLRAVRDQRELDYIAAPELPVAPRRR